LGTCFSHREQSTPLSLQELTPLAVIKAKTPALMHVGFASPQQALPHADCESHLMGICAETTLSFTAETTLSSHREQSTPLRLQKLTPLAVINAKAPALVHFGFASPQQALPHADCESHLIVATVLLDPVPVLVDPVPVLVEPVPVLVEPVPVLPLALVLVDPVPVPEKK
jgi:hypothetical protein